MEPEEMLWLRNCKMTISNQLAETESSKSLHIRYAIDDNPTRVEVFYTTRVLLAAVAEIASQKSGIKILDFGCGRGELLSELQKHGYQTYGFDIDTMCVELSSQYGTVRQGKVEDLTKLYEPRCFDLVIASHVLEHIPYPVQALTELMKFTRFGVLVAVPNPYYLVYPCGALLRINTKVNKGHWYSWDYPHFRVFVENCGFSIRKWYYDSVALPFPQRIRDALGFRVLSTIEGTFLKALLPRFCRSIIAHVVNKT